MPRVQSANTSNFNSRPSARGDHTGSLKAIAYISFQFTPLREGRHLTIDYVSGIIPISIHAPPRGATHTFTSIEPLTEISIHAPPRGATPKFRALYVRAFISIHAPPRGATEGSKWRWAHSCISIHAPPRGATLALTSAARTTRLFQFTPLREGRRNGCAFGVVGGIFQFTPLREGRQQKICNFCKSFVQPLQISMA